MDEENGIPSRACKKCGQAFPLTVEHWHRDKSRTDGFNSRCKGCCNSGSENVSFQNANRQENDFYPTPSWCVHRLLDRLDLTKNGLNWVEPCAGNGNIIKAVQEIHPNVSWDAVELQEQFKPKLEVLKPKSLIIGDFLDQKNDEPYDVIITNPPYALVDDFLFACLERAKVTVFLLRLNFLVSDKRASFLRRNRFPDCYILPNKPYFGPGVSDVEYCWYVWDEKKRTNIGTAQLLDDTSPMERKQSEKKLFD